MSYPVFAFIFNQNRKTLLLTILMAPYFILSMVFYLVFVILWATNS